MPRVFLLVLVGGWLALTSVASDRLQAAGPASPQVAASGASSSSSQARAVLDKYCVTCHNEKLKTAGFVLDTAALADVSGTGDVWEKVVGKLRAGSMPPPRRPRPDQATYDSVASWIETELDSAAAAHPNPGKLPAYRRLSRTQYKNAIRDLLALEDLPKELAIESLLPADSTASGFDNVADLLFVSPTLLERYLTAAERISRLAIGDPAIPETVDARTFPIELPQDAHVEGLPLGTRGGILIRSTFPLDGEYGVEIELAGREPSEPEQIEISVDGARVQLLTIGGEKDDAPVGIGDAYLDGPRTEARFPMSAGPHAVGIAFVERTQAVYEGLRTSSRRSRGWQPAFAAVTLIGPFERRGAGDTPSRRRLFVCRPTGPADEAPCATKILSNLIRRAYRRPVTDADVQPLRAFYQAGRAEGGFDAGIQRALERVLVSPQFLGRIERDPANVGSDVIYRISDVELASRLSFFLWNSIPDDELLELAIQGKLKEPAVLEAQVRRLLADPRSISLAVDFAQQWLYLRDLKDKRPDPVLFQAFDDGVRAGLQHETELFVDSIFRADRNVLDLLRADYTFVNERLAKHYGIPNIYGSHFRRISLAGSNRRGLLGQGSILTLTSFNTRTSPVLRGKWVLENLLAAPPPPPPPNIPLLQETTPEGEALSMREAMVAHRANPVCASCHARMDPLGFSLENFDATGRWRTLAESGEPIDASASLPDGVKFDGIGGLQELLLSHPDQFVHAFSEKLQGYALGRQLEYYDASALREVVRGAARSDYRLSSIVLGIVKSVPFQMRRSQS